MTGYGHAGRAEDGRQINVEVRCVNHRFLDLSLRLPRTMNAQEAFIRAAAGERLTRGHADISVTYLNTREDAVSVRVDDGLISAYLTAVTELKDRFFPADALPSLSYFAALPGALTEQPAPDDDGAVQRLLASALNDALDQVTAARAREGERLREDLTQHLDTLSALTGELLQIAPTLPDDYQARLTERLGRLSTPVEPQRLAQEVALFADRCAIDEELARLSAHIAEMRCLTAAEGPVGKQIDFLLQEMNREANTTASKSVSLAVTRLAVQCKNEIEKLREQAQNIL